MSDKTQLEVDLEKREHVRKPSSALILFIFLSISLVTLGIYTIKIKQELSVKDYEIFLIKRNCDNEKTELLNRIKALAEKEQRQLKSDLESAADKSNVLEIKKTQ